MPQSDAKVPKKLGWCRNCLKVVAKLSKIVAKVPKNVVKVVRKCLTHRGAAGTMTCLNAPKVGTAAPPRVKHFCNTFITISAPLAAILLHFSALSQNFATIVFLKLMFSNQCKLGSRIRSEIWDRD